MDGVFVSYSLSPKSTLTVAACERFVMIISCRSVVAEREQMMLKAHRDSDDLYLFITASLSELILNSAALFVSEILMLAESLYEMLLNSLKGQQKYNRQCEPPKTNMNCTLV